MKVKEVTYRRLFTLDDYNNETIGMIATVEEGENPDIVTGQLFQKVCGIEEVLETYRKLLDAEKRAASRLARAEGSVENIKQNIEQQKISLSELDAAIKSGDAVSQDRFRRACSARSIEDLNKDLEKAKTSARIAQQQLDKATKSKKDLKARISQGNFTVEGLELPEFEPEW